ncbi:MAG: PEP-CTERM sorting domain-containing protein [Planctomycetaceae bacterium]|nr:PEP-CTERM sorting domain-containing protein [Planctomycetaceae bacterium]
MDITVTDRAALGGGGAIEIGAVGSLAIGGSILANGGSAFGTFGGGGGSGGGILLHADSVRLTGVLSAAGGDGIDSGFVPGPSGSFTAAGGGGGGGRVTILYGPGGFIASGATIDVAGGAGGAGAAAAGYFISANGSPGGAGVVTIGTIPEPASLVLLGIGVLGLLGLGAMRRRAAPA